MKPNTNEDEMRLRRTFDFSRAERGKYFEKYKKGQIVHHLREESESEGLLQSQRIGGTRELGKQIFESQIRAAGLRWEEPTRSEDFDYILYRNNGSDSDANRYLVKVKTSSSEGFSLHKTDVHSPRSLIAYIWRVQSPEDSVVYALTFEEAFRIIQSKGYANTPSWERGGYSVTHAGYELKQMLAPFRMTPERWEHRLQEI